MKLATMFGSSSSAIGATAIGAVVLIAGAVGVSVYNAEREGEGPETVAEVAVEGSAPEVAPDVANGGSEAEAGAGPADNDAPDATVDAAEATSEAAEPAQEPETVPVLPLEAPRLDVVRVDAAGNAVIAGQTSPDLSVAIVLDGEEIAVARADGTGAFVALLSLDPSDAPRMLAVEARPENGPVLAGVETVLIAPFSSPETTIDIAAASDAEAEADGPEMADALDAEAVPETSAAAEDVAMEGTAEEAAPDATVTEGGTEVAAAETPEPTPAPELASAPEVDELALADTESAELPTVGTEVDAPSVGAEAEGAEPPVPGDGAEVAETGAEAEAELTETLATADASPETGESAEIAVTEETPSVGSETEIAAGDPEEGSAAEVASADAATTDVASEETSVEVASATPETPVEPTQRPREIGADAQGVDAQPEAQVALGDDAAAVDPEPEEIAAAQTDADTPSATNAPDAADTPDASGTPEAADTPDTAEPASTPRPSGAPAVVIAGPEGVRVVQGAASSPTVQTSVQLDAISYNTQGAVILAGRGPVASDIQVYLNNQPIQLGEVSAGGDWSLQLPDVDPGTYTLTVAGLAEDGTTTSSVETPFLREDPDRVADAPRVADGGIDVITVQPGFTLWGIAEDTFGEGILYVQIFEENQDQIRDPDWIFPGQIFRIPELATEADEN
ncbi:LysM peptidoglycan-binding domain-containing protein [Gymnodinialimonas ceratoperidinii]|uniref:LysM peptidoglycan-binding domain-containing protein n=1 Tax=Gymnodinialimonas ceratoperidinii TaxID=2856823 RepID=A0A8F6TUW4_9RHOB|nr:LysM peptidoglycan-binding domain-containing protein [Gymnodinialimonas ceratoperidinii]QXT38309.1 LysM peptidoglycan-binding domain-containing protein [Gymnodinialimonas ceratoperidinii]